MWRFHAGLLKTIELQKKKKKSQIIDTLKNNSIEVSLKYNLNAEVRP